MRSIGGGGLSLPRCDVSSKILRKNSSSTLGCQTKESIALINDEDVEIVIKKISLEAIYKVGFFVPFWNEKSYLPATL